MRIPLNRYTATAMSASAIGLLGVLPAGQASASSPLGGVPQPASLPSTETLTLPTLELKVVLDPQQIDELLAGLPVAPGSSPISPQALAQALAELPALSSLNVGALEEALKSSLEGMPSSTTLQEALENPAMLASALESALRSLLSTGELSSLESLLGGRSLSEALGAALSGVQSDEVLGRLLNGSEDPAKTLEELLASLPSSSLQEALGGLPTGEGVSEQSVEQLASKLGETPEQLAAAVGQTAAQLPATATALTAPLSNGKTLTALEGAEKIVLGTLGTPSAGGEGGAGGSSGAGGSGGGSGSSGPTVIVNEPSPTVIAQPAQPKPAASSRTTKAASLKVIGHHVHGGVATVTVSVPAAGTLVAKAAKVHGLKRKVGGAKRVRLTVRLTRASAAAARRHRKKGVAVRLQLRFTPKSGKASTAAVRLRFR